MNMDVSRNSGPNFGSRFNEEHGHNVISWGPCLGPLLFLETPINGLLAISVASL